MGLQKCSRCEGASSTTGGRSRDGVNARWHDACSVSVREFMACRVTIRRCAPLGIGTYGGGETGGATIPGVLWRVCLRWTRGVVFSVRFAVGLREFIIPGASVIRGREMIGESSTSCCSRSRRIFSVTLCSSDATLCSSGVGGGASRPMMRSRNKLRMRLPFGVRLCLPVSSDSSSTSARKCWCGDMSGS